VSQTGRGTVTVTLTGLNVTTTSDSVRLGMDNESDIDATITTWIYNTIICTREITSSKEPRLWDVAIVKGSDSSEIVLTDGFGIAEAMNPHCDHSLIGAG
jgi:hypothetical protein